MITINEKLVEIALEEVDGNNFESFCHAFMASMEGERFIPCGGMHDGGSDGFESNIYELESGRAGVYYQFSVQKTIESKITQTVKRLQAFGRTLKTLVYVSSNLIPHSDVVEDRLSDNLGIRIRIRDGKYIAVHINDSIGTQAAFKNHLAYLTEYLKQVGASKVISKVDASDPSVYVFLQQEVQNRLGNNNLLQTVADSLVLWALNGTDPQKNIFMTREDIQKKIIEMIPWSAQFIKGQLDGRLKALSAKKGTSGREVRWYRKEDKFCLPLQTRLIIEEENTNDEALRIDVRYEFQKTIIEEKKYKEQEAEWAAKVAMRTIELFFEKQGLAFASFLEDKEIGNIPNVVGERVDDALEEFNVPAENLPAVKDAAMVALGQAFYNSSEKQRYFLYNLSRTYVLLFTLKAEPRIIEYFQAMTSNFTLHVEADIIVRALTERYLEPEDQMCRNMLKIASEAGVALILSEPVLIEVCNHIKATHNEFVREFSEIEPYITRDMARHCNKILIRTYFYAKELKKTRGWRDFVNQFVTLDKINNRKGEDELKGYLVNQFNFNFVPTSELEEYAVLEKVNALASTLVQMGIKKNQELAYNDALLVHAVYGLREFNHETSRVSQYGYTTWWLTQETLIQKYTVELVRKNGAKYIMRPDFLLNFLALSPKKAEVIRSFRSIFPSTIGLQMGHRMREETFSLTLEKVKEWRGLEPGRVIALTGALSDNLKDDQLRKYPNELKGMAQILDEISQREIAN
jgi:hypothetical protein